MFRDKIPDFIVNFVWKGSGLLVEHQGPTATTDVSQSATRVSRIVCTVHVDNKYHGNVNKCVYVVVYITTGDRVED